MLRPDDVSYPSGTPLLAGRAIAPGPGPGAIAARGAPDQLTLTPKSWAMPLRPDA